MPYSAPLSAAEALRETGGGLSDEERTWADEILGVRSIVTSDPGDLRVLDPAVRLIAL